MRNGLTSCFGRGEDWVCGTQDAAHLPRSLDAAVGTTGWRNVCFAIQGISMQRVAHAFLFLREQQKATFPYRRELFSFQAPTLLQGTQYSCNYIIFLCVCVLMIMYIILIIELCRLCRFNNSEINKNRERTRFFSLQCSARYWSRSKITETGAKNRSIWLKKYKNIIRIYQMLLLCLAKVQTTLFNLQYL